MRPRSNDSGTIIVNPLILYIGWGNQRPYILKYKKNGSLRSLFPETNIDSSPVQLLTIKSGASPVQLLNIKSGASPVQLLTIKSGASPVTSRECNQIA